MKEETRILEAAQKIAEEAHLHQFRKDGTTPYIVHVKDVVNRVGENWKLQVLAWLHDTLEDSNYSIDDIIKKGIPESFRDDLESLTHKEDISYTGYIIGITKSTYATSVKIADIISNITDEPSLKQIRKYSEALEILASSIIDKKDLMMSSSTIEELVSEITEGLFENTEDPINWLQTYIDQVNSINLTSVIASKDYLNEEVLELDKPPTCIIVDCGTGETKILVYKLINSEIIFEELIKIESATKYFDKGSSFINTIRYYFNAQEADIVLISATAWLREAPNTTLEKGNELLSQLLDSGMLCKILEAKEEGWLELISAEYIGQKINLTNSSTYASGAGSTQITTDFDKIFSMKIGNEVGRNLIKDKNKEGYKEWQNIINEKLADFPIKIKGKITCISAVTYAAMAVGLPETIS